MQIVYESARAISPAEFVDVLKRSTLAERRPVDDVETMAAMVKHANLICTAWAGEKLVGVARSLTDFAYCCYLADLAVDATYQRQGIGRRLIELTKGRLGPAAKIILLAAPKAVDYYPHIGMVRHNSAWLSAPYQP
jgi:GNAT superfamily N-acetyltransferase